MIRYSLFISFLLVLSVEISLGQEVKKIEPPFWWVGMQNPNMQLMLYGEDIGDLDVESKAEGLEVVKVHKADNNNYLFVDLQIKNNTKAAAYPIHLKKGKKTITKFDYQRKQLPNLIINY